MYINSFSGLIETILPVVLPLCLAVFIIAAVLGKWWYKQRKENKDVQKAIRKVSKRYRIREEVLFPMSKYAERWIEKSVLNAQMLTSFYACLKKGELQAVFFFSNAYQIAYTFLSRIGIYAM